MTRHPLKAPNFKLLGSNLKLLRERIYQVSQQEMGERCGVSRATVARVEDGSPPSLEYVFRAGRVDPNLLFMSDHLCTRDFSRFSVEVIRIAGSYHSALESTTDHFVEVWYKKIAADMQLLQALSTPPPRNKQPR